MFGILQRKTLNQDEQQYLLNLARKTIASRLAMQPSPPLPAAPPRLWQNRGVFVTLNKDSNLRGCIGVVHGVKPLYLAVQEAALSAAFDDPRFPPLSLEEFPEISIEISVISPLRGIDSVEKIKIPRHGLLFQLGERNAVLLPQVAAKNHWDRQKLLEHVCLKAGLEKEAWQHPDAEMMTFEAQVFCE